jgi:uncharacterized protein YjdB
MRLVNWRTLVVAAAGIGLAACGDDVSITPPTLVVTPAPAQVTCNTGQTVSAGVTVSGGSGQSTVAFTGGTGITVTGSGTSVTIVCGNTAGASSVSYTVTNGSQVVTGSIPVTINQVGSPVLAVTINPQSLTVPVGGTGQLTATVSLAPNAPSGTATTVTWSSSDATIATVNATTGLVTGVKAGQTVIRATSTANTSLVASIPVTVTATSATVGNLAVSPTNVNLAVGGTQQLTTNVTLLPTAPAGTSTAVTCRSSNTAVVTVTASGCLITAVSGGSGTITVLAAADTNVRTTVGVTVATPAPVRLTIQNFRVVNAQGNQVPADLNNVTGNLFITLNLDPGDFRPDSVRVRLGSQTILCQKFSAALAEAFRLAVTTGSADVQPIECQLNTASFNQTTGVADVLNGQQNLTAEVFYRPQGGGASTTQSATINQALFLNNQSGFAVSVSNTPSAAQLANGAPANGQAQGPQGVLWRGGSVAVSVLSVNFTSATPSTAPQSLQVSLVDVNGTVATQTASVSTGAAAVATFTGTTAAYTPTPANNTITGYTSPAAGQPNGGTTVQIGGGANTTVILSSTGAAGSAPVIFIDNSSPETRAQFVSSNFLLSGGGTAGFLNGTFSFADSVQQNAAGTVLGDFNGSDRVTRRFFYAANTAALNASQIVAAGNPAVTTGANIPVNTSQTAYVLAASLADVLGNAVAIQVGAGVNGANGNFTFGVSTAAPTFSISNASTIANQTGYGVTTTTARTLIGTVSSPVGFSATPLLVTLTVISPNGTTYCATQAQVNGANVLTGADVSGAASGACTPVSATSVSIDPTTAQEGLYQLVAQARDVAGNVSGLITRTFVIDRTAPTVTNVVPSPIPLRGGQAATFTAQAADNLGLVGSLGVVNYATSTELNLRYDGAALGGQFASPFTKTSGVSITVPQFIRAISLQTALAAANLQTYGTGTATTNINAVAVGVTDAGGNPAYGTIGGAALQALLDQTQLSPTFFGSNGLQTIDLRYTPNNTTASATAAPITLNSATTGNASAVTITFRQNGVANTPFVSPFTRIQLFQRSNLPQSAGIPGSATTTAYRFIGDFSIGGLTVSPGAATINSTFTVTPGSNGITAFPTNAGDPNRSVDLLVVASDANGYAVAFIAPTLTLTNP